MNKSWIVIVLLALLPIVWSKCLTRNDTAHLSADKVHYKERKISLGWLDRPIGLWSKCLNRNDTACLSADKLHYGQRTFSFALLDSLRTARPNESLILSPHSIYRTLILAYFGANGNTEQSLADVLRLDWACSKADVEHAYVLERKARADREQYEIVEFNSAEKLYFDQNVSLRSFVKDMFSDSIEQLDFAGNPEWCRSQINAFVEEATQNNIKDLLLPGDISSGTKLVVTNAAFFKGQWPARFDEGMGLFYDHGKRPVFVEMMRQRAHWSTYDGDNKRPHASILKMPYDGEDGSISMLIILSTYKPTAIDELLAEMTTDILDEALTSDSHSIDVVFPKISFEKTFELVSVLNRMGVGDLFKTSANLSGFSETTPIKFDHAVHKAKIETVGVSANSKEPVLFRCNHPFIFLIYDIEYKEILFAGVYRGPSQ